MPSGLVKFFKKVWKFVKGGKTISRAKVIGESIKSLSSSGQVLKYVAGEYSAGNISKAVWVEAMRQEIKGEYLRQYLLGHGGSISEMTRKDWGAIGGMVKEQYKYLRGFAGDLENLSEGQIAARASMYSNSAREAFSSARSNLMQSNGCDEEAWVLGDAEHCDDCLEFAGEGWQPIGTFPEPGDGSTQCITNCQCEKIFRNTETGFEEEYD